MKIFISYSRRDADYAQQIDEYFEGSGHNVFTDVKDIQMGVVWTSALETNISNCDVFVVIITHASLRSTEVEKEVRQAQREKKTIIPCIHRDVSYDEIKWDLKSIQGVEFQDKYELSRDLYSKISDKKKRPSPPPRQLGAAPFINTQDNSQYMNKEKYSETVFKPKKVSRLTIILIIMAVVVLFFTLVGLFQWTLLLTIFFSLMIVFYKIYQRRARNR